MNPVTKQQYEDAVSILEFCDRAFVTSNADLFDTMCDACLTTVRRYCAVNSVPTPIFENCAPNGRFCARESIFICANISEYDRFIPDMIQAREGGENPWQDVILWVKEFTLLGMTFLITEAKSDLCLRYLAELRSQNF